MGVEKLSDRDYYPRYTIEDWEHWEGQWELIDGVAWAMSPTPNSDHQDLNYELLRIFKEGLKGCKKCRAFMPIDLRISNDTIVQPDVLVVCNPPAKFTRLEKAPVLVVEILSPRTATKDLHIKSGLYASIGIPYYLIAHPTEEWVRVMVLENGEWKVAFVGHEGTFDFVFEQCEVKIDFSEVWA